MDFICFMILAIVAFGVGMWAGKEADNSKELSNRD
jgi:hypothetical protein